MHIDHRARPGPIRIKRWRCQLKRPVSALRGPGNLLGRISSLGALPVRQDLLIGRLSLLLMSWSAISTDPSTSPFSGSQGGSAGSAGPSQWPS